MTEDRQSRGKKDVMLGPPTWIGMLKYNEVASDFNARLGTKECR